MGLRKAISDQMYQAGPARYYQPAYARIAAEFGESAGTFIDLGCGPGWVAVRLGEQYPESTVIGIDHSQEMIRAASKNGAHLGNVRFIRAEGAETGLASSSVRAVIAVQTVHHWSAPGEILSEASRVVAPGGRLVVLEADRSAHRVPAGWIQQTARGWPPDFMVTLGWRRFGMDDAEWADLCGLAAGAGFTKQRQRRFGFYRCLEAEIDGG